MSMHWTQHIHRLDGAYSDHTLRSYRSDFRQFAKWCRARRVPPLPAASQTVAAHLKDERGQLKPSTLKKRV